MSMRTVVYKALSTNAPLLSYLNLTESNANLRIKVSSDVKGRPTNLPLVVIRMNTANATTSRFGFREFAQIWVHDEPGDYLRIDETLGLIRQALESEPHSGTFLKAVWIDSSIDLAIDDMQTIARYSRFQLIGTSRERLQYG